jgi:hypothetical protein
MEGRCDVAVVVLGIPTPSLGIGLPGFTQFTVEGKPVAALFSPVVELGCVIVERGKLLMLIPARAITSAGKN